MKSPFLNCNIYATADYNTMVILVRIFRPPMEPNVQ